ncbi:TPA: BlaI/MecI/CopY family transcriptional regulator, partial [archaeon]|nr:BlaI/MecI/CopY family transcriptional regulator [Candidatus Naiadarchaeales archaeon SRR2090159.bin1288]
RQILEALSKADWQAPTEIVEKLDASKYATKEHAIRSINNILVRLMREGFVQREARGKAFIYALTPKVRTIFVRQ